MEQQLGARITFHISNIIFELRNLIQMILSTDFLCQRSNFNMSVTNVRACEPEPRAASREPIFASHCVFFSVFPFFAFFLNLTLLIKCYAWQEKHKFSIFLRA